MAETTIDSLQIEINAKAQKANDAIDVLVDKLDVLSNSLGKINSLKLNGFAESLNSFKGSKIPDFTRLANGIKKLSQINYAEIELAGNSVRQIADQLQSLKEVKLDDNVMQISNVANAMSRLGGKSIVNATANVPLLANALNQLMVTLSKAPTVNQSVIDMTNALANLASQGNKVGSASKAVVNGLNRTNAVAKRTASSTMSLARAFGKFYANYFLLVRGFKGLFKSIESAMELTETVNYFEVTLRNIGESAKENWKEYGYESADAYADSFAERLKESNEKLTGFAVSETGQISQSVFSGLGINPATATQYSAMFAQVANSIGMTEEASIALSEAFVRLGADWASLRNVDFEVAYEKLASGLAGQSRALRAFGVDITMATLQEIAFANGIEKSVSEMTQAEKAYLRLIAIIEQSEVAFGDLANTLESPANQMRMLTQGVKNLATLTGNLFLPIMSKALPILNGFVIALQRIVIAISEAMGIDTSGFNTSLGGMTDNFEDVSGGIDEATESAEKFNRATRGWDELNVLGKDTSNGYGVGNDLVENEELMEAYDDAIEKYRKAWNEAYKNINNEAEDFADKIVSKLNVDQLAKDFADLAESVGNIWEAVAPMLEGFASASLFTAFEAFKGIVDVLGKIADNVDPKTMKAIGDSIGTIVTNILLFKGASSIATGLSNGIKSIGTAVSAHPILSTFVLAKGILDLVHLATDTNYDESNVAPFIDSLNSISETIKGLSIEDTEGYSAEKSLQSVYEKWKAIAEKTGELTEGDKALLKTYGDMLKEMCPEVTPLIDENGRAFEGVSSKIDEAIKKTLQYYRVQASQEYLSELLTQEVKLEIETEEAKKEIRELIDRLKELNPELDEATIYNYAQNLAKGYGSSSDIMKGIEEDFGITRNFLGLRTKEGRAIYDEVANIMTDLSKLWPAHEKSLEELWDLKERIDSVAEDYAKKQDEYNESVANGTDEMGWYKDGIISVTQKLEELREKVVGMDGEKVEIDVKINPILPNQLDFFDLIMKEKGYIDYRGNSFTFPSYSTGGFPEDGLFMANHSELVGKFSNGKTAVANNSQITQGIADAVRPAVYEAMRSALRESDMGANFKIVGDPHGMFKVVREEARTFTRTTGQRAF